LLTIITQIVTCCCTHFYRRGSWSERRGYPWEMRNHRKRSHSTNPEHLLCYAARCSWTWDRYQSATTTSAIVQSLCSSDRF